MKLVVEQHEAHQLPGPQGSAWCPSGPTAGSEATPLCELKGVMGQVGHGFVAASHALPTQTCFLSILGVAPHRASADTDSGLRERRETQHPPGDMESAG